MHAACIYKEMVWSLIAIISNHISDPEATTCVAINLNHDFLSPSYLIKILTMPIYITQCTHTKRSVLPISYCFMNYNKEITTDMT